MTDSTTPPPESRRYQIGLVVLIAASSILAVVLLAVLLLRQPPAAQVSANATATPTTRASPTATAQTTTQRPSGTATPSGKPTLLPDSIAIVVTNDLVVRSLPEISDRSTIDPRYLQTGQMLFVLDGPANADGYDWYYVVPFELCCNDVVSPKPAVGWVAAAGDGEAWIAPADVACIDPSDGARWRPGLATLACHKNQTITLRGTFERCEPSEPVGSPVWFFDPVCWMIPSGFDVRQLDGIGPGFLEFQVPAGIPHLDTGTHIRMTGHLDDPAARTCVHSPVYGSEEQPPEVEYPILAVLHCRAKFVVTELTVL